MRIYTKGGDKGETSIFGGKRVRKDDLRVESLGTIDELNSLIGVCRSLKPIAAVDKILLKLQNDFFILSGDIAAPLEENVKRISQDDVTQIEKIIDEIEQNLEPLKKFIIPGGHPIASMIHFTRTVCRRAERVVVRLSRVEKINDQAIVYLNRLSDLLFVLARWVNKLSNISDSDL